MNEHGTEWSATDTVSHYEQNRRRLEDLYPSERYFFDDAIKGSASILDIGCAAGGMYEILKSVKTSFRYSGVDISQAMLSAAGKRFPEASFARISENRLPFEDNSFDTAICFGVLHMEINWKKLLAEAWRVSSGKILFDLRLHHKVSGSLTGKQNLMFSGNWDGVSVAPYIILGVDEFKSALDGICGPSGYNLNMYGYWHNVSHMTDSEIQTVCMTAILLEKQAPGKSRSVKLNLPCAIKKQFCPELEIKITEYEKACIAINSLEKEFDTEKFSYLGMNYWPVLRNIIGYTYVYSVPHSLNSLLGSFSSSWFMASVFSENALKQALLDEYIRLERQIGEAEIKEAHPALLFFTSGFEYIEYKGGYYNKFFDPLKEELAESGIAVSDIHAEFQHIRREPSLHKSRNISDCIRRAEMLAFVINAATPKAQLVDYSKLRDRLKTMFPFCPELPGADRMKYHLSRMIAYSWMFRKIISSEKPFMGILTCYYHDLGMAFIDACKKSGVPTLEIQHSHINSWDWNWLHWNTSTEGPATDLVPENIGVWDKNFEKLFEKHRPHPLLKPFIIGNLWFKKIYGETSSEQKIEELRGAEYRKILYTAPFCTEDSVELAIPDMLLKVFADTPEGAIWLIRTHYKTEEKTLRKIQERLSTANAANKIICLRDKYSLYALFKQCDVHVSQTSTTVLEAEYFGLKNIIIGNAGKIWFDDKIGQGIYFYASTGEELIHQLKLAINSGKKKESGVMKDSGSLQKYFNNWKNASRNGINVNTENFKTFIERNISAEQKNNSTKCMDRLLPTFLKILFFIRRRVSIFR